MTKTPHAEFTQRRKQLMAQLPANSVAILAAAPEAIRSNDTEYPYRQNSDFYYLTGFSEPEAIAVLMPGRKQGEYILFNRVRDPAKEVWTGSRVGQEGAVKDFGADESFPIKDFITKLPELLLGRASIFYKLGYQKHIDEQLITAVNSLERSKRMGVVSPTEFIGLEQYLHEMRKIKSPLEINLMRQAAKISAQAHVRAMQVCRPGMFEYQLEAELQYEFLRNGSHAPAYNSIVASGKNACTLHYNDNNCQIQDGDLVLIDAACEYENYASDITRTFPANGRFTPEQRAIYEIVLAAQLAALDEVRPGSTLDKVHMTSVRVIVEGLNKLGILPGKVADLIEQKAYLPFYMHRANHWLGLDTHDVGIYKIKDEWCKLEPGFVLTVEPGIYIAAGNPAVDKKWWNIGVRIEDDVLVTAKGCEILSDGVPKTVDEIEKLMKK